MTSSYTARNRASESSVLLARLEWTNELWARVNRIAPFRDQAKQQERAVPSRSNDGLSVCLSSAAHAHTARHIDDWPARRDRTYDRSMTTHEAGQSLRHISRRLASVGNAINCRVVSHGWQRPTPVQPAMTTANNCEKRDGTLPAFGPHGGTCAVVKVENQS